MALFWRLLLFLTLTTIGSGLHVSVNPLKARMKAGSNVLLSCLFDTGESRINLAHLAVTWTLQGDHSVAEFQYGETNTWKGVRLFKDELINGNASVLIRKLTKADMGTYRCEVEYSTETAHQQMNLQIYEKELQVHASSSKVQVNKGDNAVLNCTFTIDGPHVDQDHLEVRWLFNGTQVISFNKIERPTRENAHLFGVMKSDASLVLPEVKIEEEGNYTCYVKYTPEEASQSIHLKVTDPKGNATEDPHVESPPVERLSDAVVTKTVPATELYNMRSTRGVESVSAVDLGMVTVSVMDILPNNAEVVRSINSGKSAATEEQMELMDLLKPQNYIMLASLIVIISVIIILLMCSRKRRNYNVSKKESKRRLI